MNLSRLELLGGAALLTLLGAGTARLATPERPPLRSLSVEGIHIEGEAIAQGQTLVRERGWTPGVDVYVIGWMYSIHGLGGDPELLLMHKGTVLFVGTRGGIAATNPAFYAQGSGFRVQAGEPITLRFSMTNEGAPGRTRSVSALVYFVPVAGN